MASVDVDIVEGSALRHTSDGYEKTRVAMVRGLTGSESAREYDAMNTSGVPSRGEFHPDIPFIRVEDRSAQAEGPDLVKVTLVYRSPGSGGGGSGDIQEGDDPIIEVGGTLEISETDTDKDGTLITVDYSGDTDNPAIPEYVEPVQWSRPHGLLRYTRRELISGADLQSRIDQYVGKVNSVTFGPFAIRTMLLSRLSGRSDDGGQTYIVTYEFAYERDTWDAKVKAVNPETGQIPAGVTSGDGQETYRIYDEIDFGGLGL